MTLHEKIEKSAEKLKKIFDKAEQEDQVPFELEGLKSFLRETQLSLLEEVKKEIEKMPTKFSERESDEFDAGYSLACRSIIEKLDEEIKKIK